MWHELEFIMRIERMILFWCLILWDWDNCSCYLWEQKLYLFTFHLAFLVVSVAKLCLALWDPVDYSPPGSSVHGISQARILEWVAISFSKASSQPRDQTRVSSIGRHVLYHWATREASCFIYTDYRNTRGMLMHILVYLEVYECVCLTLKDKVANSKMRMHAYNVW